MPISRRRRTLLGSVAGLFGLGGTVLMQTGCGGTSDDQASLRFVNGTADYATADFWIGSDRVSSSLSNGGSATGYVSADSGTSQLSLNPVGSSTAKYSASHDFATDSYTTVLALGSLASNLTFQYVDESTAAAASSEFKVRVLQGASSLGALDVYIANDSSLSGLSPTISVSAYGELSGFVSLASGSYRVRVTRSGDQGSILFDFTAGLSVGGTTVLTLVIVPRTSGSLPNIAALPEKATSIVLANELA